MNAKEINLKLFEKRKKHFPWQLRYDMIMREYQYKTLQWKMTYLNGNINLIPQREAIRKENEKRFIKMLKINNLYEEWENELDEFMEFKIFYEFCEFEK
jgi:hypothetical protein